MATRTLFLLSAAIAASLAGAQARADDLPANDWVPIMDVVAGMERVGFAPIAKIEAKDGNWLVHAYRRSVLYEIRVDSHANSIKSVSAEQVTVCGKSAAEAPPPSEGDKKAREKAEVPPQPSEEPNAPAVKDKGRAKRKSVVSAREPVTVKPRSAEKARHDTQMRALAQFAAPRRNVVVKTKPVSARQAIQHRANPIIVRRGFVVAPGRVQWDR